MVRRLKEDIREVQGGFPKRHVERIAIDDLPDDAPELVLSRLLDEYRTAREERFAATSSRAQAAAGLLVVGLQQRLLSSIEAFARSLEVHRATVERQWAEAARRRPSAHVEDEAEQLAHQSRMPTTSAPSWTAEELEADEAARDRGRHRGDGAAGPARRRRRASCGAASRTLLDRMQEIAEEHRHQPGREDPPPDRLDPREPLPGPPAVRQAPRRRPAEWNNRRVLIFTENREGTKRYLKTILEQAIEGTDRADERIEVITA